ncbi:MAG: CoA-binding protein [Alphaproteobacteria bacterium]|nr:CoA-binding protein [Alphaproteobacteria bacterium]
MSSPLTYSEDYIAGILRSVKTIAMVGASANQIRPSWFAMKYLQEKGFRIIPVNPAAKEEEILGEKVYASLADIPVPVDMVDIFRSSEAAGEIIDEVIRLKEKLCASVVWMQLTVINHEAAARAEAAGFKVVMDRCPKIEYGRLCGDIGFMGVNRRIIDNKRKPLGAGRGALSRNALGQGKGQL